VGAVERDCTASTAWQAFQDQAVQCNITKHLCCLRACVLTVMLCSAYWHASVGAVERAAPRA
jgi:hypothetical protein